MKDRWDKALYALLCVFLLSGAWFFCARALGWSIKLAVGQ